MAVQHRVYTADDFWEIAGLSENAESRLELIEGVIREMSPSSQRNAVIAGLFVHYLNAFVLPRKLGYVSGADGGFKLSERDVRVPDAAFISKERHAALGDKNFPVAPDLAVEVVSEHDTASEVRGKVALYLSGGARLVWVVYPDKREVDVCRLDKEGSLTVRTVGMDGVLDGGDALPGFSLPVRDVFPE